MSISLEIIKEMLGNKENNKINNIFSNEKLVFKIDDIGFVLTVIRDNTTCKDTEILLDLLIGKLFGVNKNDLFL